MEGNQRKKDYVFASARVRSVEKSLLTREKVEAMRESKTPAEALKILLDQDYGSGSEGIKPEDFEELLSEERKKVYQFIMGIVPVKEDLYPFLYPYDYHNLKVLMKAELSETDSEQFLIDLGTIPPGELAIMVRERNFVAMSPTMKNALQEVVDVFSRTKDPQTIDFILDRACYEEMVLGAEASGNVFIQGYIRLLVDTVNLKTFTRLRQMGKNWDFFSQVFLRGGNIQEKVFISGYDEPYEQLAEKLIPFGLSTALGEGGAMLRETGRFTALERLCDDALMNYAREAKYISFGIEPLAAYLIAKEGEMKNARIVMTGLLQGLSPEMLAERVRETYV
ncbi:MAG: V-type ATP synthase subunit C [Eubacteriales bacterium]|nr:V-type ATP synthase subunit C [Eubacteriales bacterium]MDD4582847.1 V-type ATP synthase subunit C [Eubacteriales bacterium]